MRNVNWVAVFIMICFMIGLITLFLGLVWVVQQVLTWGLGGITRW